MEDRFVQTTVMVRTGVNFFQVISVVALLIPLIPLFIIVLRRSYNQEILNFLMVLCLLTFIQHLINLPWISTSTFFPGVILELSRFTLLILILKTTLTAPWQRQVINIFLISFLSVTTTIYISQGIEPYHRAISLVQSILILVLTLIAFVQLKKNNDLFLLNSPVFWIAAGTLFYYFIFLLVECVSPSPSSPAMDEKKLMMIILGIVQFGFYAVAAGVRPPKSPEESKPF